MSTADIDPAEDNSAPHIWIDVQLPPALAKWLRAENGADAVHINEIGLLNASDVAIFKAARAADRLVVLMTKDDDFVKLLGQRGPPPRVVWLRCGNITNHELRRVMVDAWPQVRKWLANGEPLVEIRRRRGDTEGS